MKKQTLSAIAACSLIACTGSTVFAASSGTFDVSVSGQGTWETTLQGRDLDGNAATTEAYYDTVLDVTWMADVFYAGTEMTWSDANAWAATLDPYGSGITGWRLPYANPIDGTTANDENFSYIGTEDRGTNISAPGTMYAGSTANELAHMSFNTLGNLSYCDPSLSTTSSCSGPQPGWGISNTGPFSNVKHAYFWTAMEYAPDNDHYAWHFDMSYGNNAPGYKYGNYQSWAVHDGDVGASVVPIPAAAWLFGSGLLGLIGIARKK
ncbi:hypothetical protein [Thiohalobacter thiocyanaticus]|uniref:hypothetical protein n=1 Tax=Thiohalobacter thiocyanaticus TaxID=585455 RepID=UPI0015A8AE7C|nr:hypothetical protein [Thiohalobacter thiocyanaticus]